VTSHRPYLVRALNEWILDNDATPYIIVDTTIAGVVVPDGLSENGRIVLNIGPNSIRDLQIGNDTIEFDGRFAGRAFHVSAPVRAIMAVYAKETGQGMAFEAEPAGADESVDKPAPGEATPGGHLRVVK
jgi:stringent starvation protein B